MGSVVWVRFFDTDSGELRRGELVNPFGVGDDVAAIWVRDCDAPEITVMASNEEGEWLAFSIKPENISAVGVMS